MEHVDDVIDKVLWQAHTSAMNRGGNRIEVDELFLRLTVISSSPFARPTGLEPSSQGPPLIIER